MRSKNSYESALITGATSGLGNALADFLETKDIPVWRLGSKDFDLTQPSERQKLLALITEKKPDLIVNNAGFGLYGPSLELSLEEQCNMLEVNCTALMEISLHAAKIMRDAGKQGTILNISSLAAFFAFPTFNVYSASKAFVKNFSLALDAELKDSGIRVLCACPGQIETNFRNRAAKGHPQSSDHMTMSAKAAIHYLWKQITQQKPLSVFGWRAKMLLWSSRLLPRPLLNHILEKSLSDRYQ